MTSAIYDNCMQHIGIGEIQWVTGNTNIYSALIGDAPPVKTDSHYSSIIGELGSGNGYTSGGNPMAPTTVSIASNVAVFDSENVSWLGASLTAYYAIVYQNAGTPPLISYHDFRGPKTVTSGRFTVEWAYDGVFNMTTDPAS
jgi:hypothetical protein